MGRFLLCTVPCVYSPKRGASLRERGGSLRGKALSLQGKSRTFRSRSGRGNH